MIRRLIHACQVFSWPELQALWIAILLHGKQKRKYTGEPYWYHVLSVAESIKLAGYQTEMVIAALLHDTLEDPLLDYSDRCGYLWSLLNSIKRIDHLFTLQLIVDLTDVYIKRDFPHLIRVQRKALELERQQSISHFSKIIKLADIIDNTKTIRQFDSNFFTVYKKECLDVVTLCKTSDPKLYLLAYAGLNNQ